MAKSGVEVPEEAVKAGLENVKWPGRIETLKRRPLLIVDSAHTADSARRLRDTLLEYLRVDRATLVIGVMGDKDLEGLAMAIEPAALRVIATQADHPRALGAEAVARVFRDQGIETFVEPKLGAAIDMATSLSTASDAVVILGSIALAGEARAYVLGLERDPPV
jgi:dihydrofolate synthase/folylpolyglutamate synthase